LWHAVKVSKGDVPGAVSTVTWGSLWVAVFTIGHSIRADLSLIVILRTIRVFEARWLLVEGLRILVQVIPVPGARAGRRIIEIFASALSSNPSSGPSLMRISLWRMSHAVEEREGQVSVAASAVTGSGIGVAGFSVSDVTCLRADFSSIR